MFINNERGEKNNNKNKWKRTRKRDSDNIVIFIYQLYETCANNNILMIHNRAILLLLFIY